MIITKPEDVLSYLPFFRLDRVDHGFQGVPLFPVNGKLEYKLISNNGQQTDRRINKIVNYMRDFNNGG